jgi:hypothetical protein
MELVTGAAVVSALLGGTVVVAVPAMQDTCKTEIRMYQDGPVTVKTCDDRTEVNPIQIIGTAAAGTGGLVFRDENGNDLGSGIGEGQRFIFVNCGPKDSGLINVYQLDSAEEDGKDGGWGGLYAGYVKKAYTDNASDYPCN